MDAANAIGRTSYLYVMKQRLISHISGDRVKEHNQKKSDTTNTATVYLLTESVKAMRRY